MLWVSIFIAVVIIGAVFLVIMGLRDSGRTNALDMRLADFAARGEITDLEEIELSQPLTERVIFPVARRLGDVVLRFTPQNAIQSTSRKLELAGNPSHLDPTLFLSLRLLGISLGFLLLFVAAIAPQGSILEGKGLIYGIPSGALGYFLPELWLRGKISRRQHEIRKAMPDALDLLTICVEAGLGFDGAMQKVFEKWDNELGRALGRVIREIQLGKLRREALRDMADRLGVAEMSSFIAAVIQSEQLGVSMAKVLRIQADQMRIKRRQRAEVEAHKAPLKMLLPMAFLIFPSICIVLLTPALLMLLSSSLRGVFGF
ncbi:MAG TPA: type II secretion system F family protein [Anaerolineales bacterium]|nr:type II secretion system F family protein [Anaerolineales bacterium]